MFQNKQSKKNFFSLRKRKLGLVSVGLVCLFMGLGNSSVLAEDFGQSTDTMAEAREAPSLNNILEEQIKEYQKQGFDIEEKVVQLPFTEASKAIVEESYQHQMMDLKTQVEAYHDQVARGKAEEEAYQNAQTDYDKKVQENQEAHAWNNQQSLFYQNALKTYDQALKDLGEEYQFSQEDKKDSNNRNTEELSLYGTLDQSQQSHIKYYQDIKIKADLDYLKAHSLQDSLAWTERTEFKKLKGSYTLEAGYQLSNDTKRVQHLTKLTDYQLGDSFKLTNVGKIETGQDIHLQVTFTSIGDGFGTKIQMVTIKFHKLFILGKFWMTMERLPLNLFIAIIGI